MSDLSSSGAASGGVHPSSKVANGVADLAPDSGSPSVEGLLAKASLSSSMAAVYEPSVVESGWDAWWQSRGFYQPRASLNDYTAASTAMELVHADADGRQDKRDGSTNRDERLHAAGSPSTQCAASLSAPHSSLLAPASTSTSTSTGTTDSTARRFVMVIPPPNVTGTLHLGHALTCSVEDALTRWHRMLGDETVWVPGTDHAGIATQAVVEKQLKRDSGLLRTQLTRPQFVERVWQWKEQSGGVINQQLHRLGVSVDWSRERFTMDDRCSRAVLAAFVTLHEQGRIYRADKLVNWSCALKTAISQIEVEYINIAQPVTLTVPNHPQPVQFGLLHTFAYPLVPVVQDGGSDKEVATDEVLLVSTTRLETLLGDVAVAVHPDDERYRRFHGRHVRHPLILGRHLPIVCDAKLVDMSYGSGVVKVTPAHDQSDYECAARHGLPSINIFNDDGTMNEQAGSYCGLPRFVCREQVQQHLTARGLYRGSVHNSMVLGLCSRSGDVIEPMLRAQWWMDCDKLAQQANQAVKDGRLRLLPVEYVPVWDHWLTNIQHWCISRQLWWGHRIPAYRVLINGQPLPDTGDSWVVALDEHTALSKAELRFGRHSADTEEQRQPHTVSVVQDEDVLDTWFSSALFPFSVFGWPDSLSADLQRYYPTSLLETGHDILFFWVARMVMMGLALTGELPFKQVFLHPMVRDKQGRKMSKSLGNIIDPLDVIQGQALDGLLQQITSSHLPLEEKQRAMDMQRAEYPHGIPACGSDALRFGLLAYMAQAHDINLDIQRIVAYRQFANKLWQANRFACHAFQTVDFNRGTLHPIRMPPSSSSPSSSSSSSLSLPERWMLSCVSSAVNHVQAAMQRFDFAAATTACYDLWLYQLCDTYIELIKPTLRRLAAGDLDSRPLAVSSLSTLFVCLHTGLRLLHPFMPFVTEELFHRLQTYGGMSLASTPAAEQTEQGVCLGVSSWPSVMVSPFPLPAYYRQFSDQEAESTMQLVQTVSRASRSMRSSAGLTRTRADLTLTCPLDVHRRLLPHTQHVATLGKLNAVSFVSHEDNWLVHEEGGAGVTAALHARMAATAVDSHSTSTNTQSSQATDSQRSDHTVLHHSRSEEGEQQQQRRRMTVRLSATMELLFEWDVATDDPPIVLRAAAQASASSISDHCGLSRWSALYKQEQRLWALDDRIAAMQAMMDQPSFRHTESALQQLKQQQLRTLHDTQYQLQHQHQHSLQQLTEAERRQYVLYRLGRLDEDVSALTGQVEQQLLLQAQNTAGGDGTGHSAKASVRGRRLLAHMHTMQVRRAEAQAAAAKVNAMHDEEAAADNSNMKKRKGQASQTSSM